MFIFVVEIVELCSGISRQGSFYYQVLRKIDRPSIPRQHQ